MKRSHSICFWFVLSKKFNVTYRLSIIYSFTIWIAILLNKLCIHFRRNLLITLKGFWWFLTKPKPHPRWQVYNISLHILLTRPPSLLVNMVYGCPLSKKLIYKKMLFSQRGKFARRQDKNRRLKSCPSLLILTNFKVKEVTLDIKYSLNSFSLDII